MQAIERTTQGTWAVEEYSCRDMYAIVVENSDPDDEAIADVHGKDKTGWSNAHVIAAAPRLYEALRDVIDFKKAGIKEFNAARKLLAEIDAVVSQVPSGV